ncbi:disease resistance protein RUN1-like isoform X2 [Nymphaea colorata]|uniref:disease resistance protein RUN1-like isoform X2 n=1 Tax=Nymphaea colorata TaxID=210225 RepID=UPI00129DF317|nr:disease resistance protein RUN1-like isoform X2 [Nymphaea colorata]
MQSNKAGPSKSTLHRNFHGRFEYDVFLSYRGEDTRKNFAGLFRHILDQKGIHAFFDDLDLQKGEKIEEILDAISRSRFLVPIFSQNYAESKWCLREVAKMVECRKDGGQERLIVPVFFDVNPKDVRHQSGPFKAAFLKHKKERREEVDGWKRALEYVGGISGYDLKAYNGNQSELVSSMVEKIQTVLASKMPLDQEEEYLVGLDRRIEKMMELMDIQVKDVRIIGIHGVGGVGKTTLAKAIYNKCHHKFQASSFIENVREVYKSKGPMELQKQLIQDFSHDKHKINENISSKAVGMIKQKASKKTVLLVLDDVDDKNQLDALAGKRDWFHPGSRIIVTTRQAEILKFAGLQDDAVYMVEELDGEESLQLFKYHAFGDQEPQEKYTKLSKEVVSISNGLPLVVQVFGSLFKTAETPEECDELLKDLRSRRQVSEVHEKLRICYDSLKWNERYIFLDIACLLVGKSSEDAIYMWDGDNLLPHLAIRSLQNRSLIKINKGKFEMHDQIRDMGREIVMTENPSHPEKRSRLWCEEDVVKALTKLQGNKIQGILLNSREESKAKLSTEAFELMSEIRILFINLANFSYCEFQHLPASLKWLEWKGCPLPTLPLESKFKSIVVLNLSRSFISQLWTETPTWSSSIPRKELFDGLKVLDLSCCGCLNATPNFAMAPNLEKLILDECNMLKEVDDSIGSLKKLVFLSIRECVSLEKLPNEIYGLSSLVVFNLEGCSTLVAFPQFLPTNSTTGFLKLEQLILRDCQSLEVLPDLLKFQSLRSLHIDGCQGLDHRRKHLFEDVAFKEWDELGISGSRTPSYEQEFSFLLPVGSINDPLLLQHLQCHGYGDPCENRTIKLHVRHEDTAKRGVLLETMHEAHCDNSKYKDDVYVDCYTINFGRNDKINEVPRGKTIIMKVKAANNFELTKVDVKVQKRSKFRDENMKPFISISRRNFQIGLSIFFDLHEADKLDAIEYSTRMEKRIDDILMQLNVPCGEQMLFFDWIIEELIILTLIFGDIDASWYEQRHGTRLPRQETSKVLEKIKVVNLSYCKFLVKTPDLARIPNLEELILDHCECLLEIGESIGQLKRLILLSMVGCANLGFLPCGILQLNSLQRLSLQGCSKIKFLPEASRMNVRLESLQLLILDHCTSLTEIPDYVVGLKCLRCLSLKGCSLLKQIPSFIESSVALEELILDHCTSLTEMPYYVGQLKCLCRLSLEGYIGRHNCLRRLSLEGCSSLERLPSPMGRSVRTCPHWLGNLKRLTKMQSKNPRKLASVPDLSNLTALEELSVEFCTNLVAIPGLQNLRSLKVLYMNGCWHLDLNKIWSQLKEAAFHDLQAFRIGCKNRSGVKTISLPFPRGGRLKSERLQLEKMGVLVERKSKEEIMDHVVKVPEDDSVLNVGVAVRSRLFPPADRPQMALQLREDLESPYAGYHSYTARFGKDDEINKHLRLEPTSATRVPTLHISCQDPTFRMVRANISFHT